MDDVTMAPVDELVDALKAAGVACSMDAAELNLPGAWLALDEVRPFNLKGTLQLRMSLYLICPDTDPYRALGILSKLFNLTREALEPDGAVTPQGVVMPSDPTPLPALRVPIYLYTESE